MELILTLQRIPSKVLLFLSQPLFLVTRTKTNWLTFNLGQVRAALFDVKVKYDVSLCGPEFAISVPECIQRRQGTYTMQNEREKWGSIFFCLTPALGDGLI